MGDSKIFKNLLSKLNFFSFKYSGRANNAGIKNKVKRLENPSPQITAVENGTHQADIRPPNSMLLPNQSIVVWSATGVKPIIVVVVVKTIGLNLWEAEWSIASLRLFASIFNLLNVSINTIELLGQYSINKKNFLNFNLENSLKKTVSQFNLNADYDNEIDLKIINYKKSKDDIAKISLNLEKNKNILKINKLTLSENENFILIKDMNFAHCVANYIAPEHLEIMTKNKKLLAKKIKNAGAIFMGEYTPEAFGDYIAGPSHVLPTSGNARFDSGLSVLDFLKRTSYIEANKTGLKNTLHSIETLGNSEGLDAHVMSAKIRFSKD